MFLNCASKLPLGSGATMAETICGWDNLVEAMRNPKNKMSPTALALLNFACEMCVVPLQDAAAFQLLHSERMDNPHF